MMKTPDALLNGQSVVNVIQSCLPNIKNAWQIPSIDVDAILIAVRIATYGEKMEIETRVLSAGTERKFDLDLRQLLDRYAKWEQPKPIFYIGVVGKHDF